MDLLNSFLFKFNLVKIIVFFIVMLCIPYALEAQLIIDQPEPEVEQMDAEQGSASFVPHPRLLDQTRWTRVSTYRFECEFLRLAVEFKDHSYVLMEMDGEKRILARSIDYNQITNRIIELTIRPRPNLDQFH